jgi:predicted DNA-binding protein
MQKATAKRRGGSSASDPQYKTTGFRLPKSLWELLNRVAFERTRTKGGASVPALLVELVERHKKELEKELA